MDTHAQRPPAIDLDRLIEVLEIDPEHADHLALACAHRSWCAEHPGFESNERLEFLGDSVLGFVVAAAIYRDNPDLDEGALTEVRKSVVNSVYLAEVAIEIDLGRHLLLGKGEEQSGGRDKPSIIADALEAVLGAVYLDQGVTAVADVVERLLGDRIDAVASAGGRAQDHKSRLQERLAHDGRSAPKYTFEATGPDHARQFTAAVAVDGELIGTGEGRSKKQAEQAAAKQAVVALGPDGSSCDDADEQGEDQGG